VAVVVVMGLAVAVGWWWVSRARPATAPLVVAAGAALSVMPTAASGSPSSRPSVPVGEVVVHVLGRVHHPGLVRLPAGSRVADAIRAAGGVLAGVPQPTINLARHLTDGEQIAVGVDPPVAEAGSPSASADAVIDLNSATVDQLDTLPGVGPVLASRIVDWRTAHGRFTSVDELREVAGVGERKFADLSARVRV